MGKIVSVLMFMCMLVTCPALSMEFDSQNPGQSRSSSPGFMAMARELFEAFGQAVPDFTSLSPEELNRCHRQVEALKIEPLRGFDMNNPLMLRRREAQLKALEYAIRKEQDATDHHLAEGMRGLAVGIDPEDLEAIQYNPFTSFDVLYPTLCAVHGEVPLPRFNSRDMTPGDNLAINNHVNRMLNRFITDSAGSDFDPADRGHVTRLFALIKTLEFFAVTPSEKSDERPAPKPYETLQLVMDLGNGFFLPAHNLDHDALQVGDNNFAQFKEFYERSQLLRTRHEGVFEEKKGDLDAIDSGQFSEDLLNRLGIQDAIPQIVQMAQNNGLDPLELTKNAARLAASQNVAGAQKNVENTRAQYERSRTWYGYVRALSFFKTRTDELGRRGRSYNAQVPGEQQSATLAQLEGAAWNSFHFQNLSQIVIATVENDQTRLNELLNHDYRHPEGDAL